MCIRDRQSKARREARTGIDERGVAKKRLFELDHGLPEVGICLLYTSDAADERSSVDLGGRRIIKKQNSTTRLAHASMPSTTAVQ